MFLIFSFSVGVPSSAVPGGEPISTTYHHQSRPHPGSKLRPLGPLPPLPQLSGGPKIPTGPAGPAAPPKRQVAPSVPTGVVPNPNVGWNGGPSEHVFRADPDERQKKLEQLRQQQQQQQLMMEKREQLLRAAQEEKYKRESAALPVEHRLEEVDLPESVNPSPVAEPFTQGEDGKPQLFQGFCPANTMPIKRGTISEP